MKFKTPFLLGLLGMATISFETQAIIIPEGKNEADYKIEESEYPFVFPVVSTITGVKECGATLIYPNWAITAAHCTPPVQSRIQNGGVHKVTIAGVPYIVDRVVVHPKAPEDGAFTNETVDLALLHFKDAVEGIDPVPLYGGADEVGQIITMMGWGEFGTSAEGPIRNDFVFRRADNRVSDVDGHFLFFTFDNPESPQAVQLEAVGGPGDSGVPGLFKTKEGSWVLAGVSSGQLPPEDGPDRPGAYGSIELFMRVSALKDWIEGVMNGDT